MTEVEYGGVWHLVIENTGASDRELHNSLHVGPKSARNKAEEVLNYDVPELDEWYTRPTPQGKGFWRIGYVLDRDEIDAWPIRIEVERREIHNE